MLLQSGGPHVEMAVLYFYDRYYSAVNTIPAITGEKKMVQEDNAKANQVKH
jgi:hypothetical protein